MKEIIKILKNYKLLWKIFWVTISIAILTESTFLVFPQINKWIIEVIENKWVFDDILLLGIIGFLVLIFSVIWWYIVSFLNAKMWSMLYIKKNQLYREKLFKKNYSQIIDEWTWKLISKFSRAVEAEADIFMATIHILTNTVFKLFSVTIIFIYFLPWFVIVLVIFLILMFSINLYIKKNIKEYVKSRNDLYESDSRLMVRMINDFLTIKIFNKVEIELLNSRKVLKNHPFYSTKIKKYQGLLFTSLFFFIKFLEFSTYIFIWYFILKWELTISLLIMILWYIWLLWNPIDVAITEFNRIVEQIEVYKKLQEFIEKPNEIENWKEEYIYKTWKIEFKNIDFGYSEKNRIFEKLNLTFLEWKKNALVGHSWGWKSTIIKILLRLYDYQNWEILLDWQELKNLKIESFYKEIWYLPQEPWIFDWTIRENLEYAFAHPHPLPSKEGSKESKIWEALKKAQISEMVKKLEKGLDTEVWEKWVKLSWGEKQRLAIARIFLKNPKIIILDEPTSALDSISEAGITKALDELMKNRTSIVIAHRLQTVMHSDKIIVLENGKIESEWKHNELMEKSDTYKTLVDLQNGKIGE